MEAVSVGTRKLARGFPHHALFREHSDVAQGKGGCPRLLLPLHLVVGPPHVGDPRLYNMLFSLAAYAAICKHEGERKFSVVSQK